LEEGMMKISLPLKNVLNQFFMKKADIFVRFGFHFCLQTLSAMVFIVCKQKLGYEIKQNYQIYL